MTEQDEPIARVAHVLLEYSLKENAAMISIRHAADKINVSYRIGDTWHERMTMPDYVWAPLRDHLTQIAGAESDATGETGVISFPWQGHDYRFTISLTPERITLEPIVAQA